MFQSEIFNLQSHLNLLLQYNLGNRMLTGVGNGEVRSRRSKLLEDFKHLPPEYQIRRAALPRRNFHILPTDTTAPTRLQSF